MDQDPAERVIGRLEGIAESIQASLEEVKIGQRESVAALKDHALDDRAMEARLTARIESFSERISKVEPIVDMVEDHGVRLDELDDFRDQINRQEALRAGQAQGEQRSDAKWNRRTVAVATAVGAAAGASGVGAASGFLPKLAKFVASLFGGHGA